MKSKRLDPCVVDTNVPMVANGKSTAGAKCMEACAKKLNEIVERGHVVIDDSFLLLSEYRANLNSRGQPGVGDHFYRWVLTNRGNSTRCTCVRITPTPEGSYTEFPRHPDLEGFDPSDHKFIAVRGKDLVIPRLTSGQPGQVRRVWETSRTSATELFFVLGLDLIRAQERNA